MSMKTVAKYAGLHLISCLFKYRTIINYLSDFIALLQ